ncbi:MAG TPA: PilZ domain-containing protein [Terracidiphilus sp.]|nr:PilZ domain-containing protein [Terracidiphilus sp.]
MGAGKYCVYNKSRETLLSAEVAVIDTTKESFRALIDDLAANAKTGLWLKPFRGIPEARQLPRFDLLYLDETEQVIKGAELFSPHEFAPFAGRVASALALPPGALASSRTQAGDQISIFISDDGGEMARSLAQSPGATASSVSIPSSSSEPERHPDFQPARKLSLLERFQSWLRDDKDRRRAERRALPGLVAYFWTGGSPQSYELGNISISGVYLLTDERWVFETVLQLRLQKTDAPETDPDNSVPVLAKVVRWGVDGVGLEFILSTSAQAKGGPTLPGPATDVQALLRFLHGLSHSNGSSGSH